MRIGSNAVRAAALGLATAVTLACAATPAEPEDPLAPGSLAERRGVETRGGILELREQLGLTYAQVAEIQQIMKDLEAANAPLRAQLRPADEQRPGRDAARAVMEQIRDHVRTAQEQIRGVLTDAQEAKLRELRPERPERPHGERGGRGGPGFGGPMLDLLRLRERLELTDDQVSRLREMRQQLEQENRPLLEQLRQSGERPRGADAASNPLIQQIQENVREAAEQMKAVLTAEQTTKLEELRQQMEERRGRWRDGAPGEPRGGAAR